MSKGSDAYICDIHSCGYLMLIFLPQAHPSQAYFAVGEKGTKPFIAIYTYPDLKLHRILRGR